jgi:hypothetical protein
MHRCINALVSQKAGIVFFFPILLEGIRHRLEQAGFRSNPLADGEERFHVQRFGGELDQPSREHVGLGGFRAGAGGEQARDRGVAVADDDLLAGLDEFEVGAELILEFRDGDGAHMAIIAMSFREEAA